MSKDRFKTLRALNDDLAKADAAQALLDEVWAWCGPYGPEYRPSEKARNFLATPDGRKLMEAIKIPDALRYKLQNYYEFDDSE